MTAVADPAVGAAGGDPTAPPVAVRQRGGGLLSSGWTKGAGLLVAVGVLVLVVGASLAFGSKSIPIDRVVDALLHGGAGNEALIVRSIRVPRTITGIGVGVALGLAGAVMQGVTRNPLADPAILGIEAGASLAVVCSIRFLDVSSAGGFVWFAFGGAALASVVVYGLGAMGRGGATPVKLALAGASMGWFFSSLTTAVLLLDISTLDEFRFWVVGSLAGRDGDLVRDLLPFLAVGVVLALASARSLNALALGDDVAHSLGMRVNRARLVAFLAVVVLTGMSVAAAGPVGFIGLTIPHIARAICGPDHRWVLPWSMVLGPILLVGADVVGRVVIPPGELQVGIVTAVIGAPFFITLVRRRKLSEL